MDLNLIDSVTTSDRPLAQPVLALPSKLKHPGEKNPRFLSLGLIPPAGLPTSPLGPCRRRSPPRAPGCSAGALSRLRTRTFASFKKKKKKS